MKNMPLVCILAFLISCSAAKNGTADKGWISLFNGTSLQGWKAAENPSTFSVEDSTIVVHGARAHLFYEGPVMNHEFKKF